MKGSGSSPRGIDKQLRRMLEKVRETIEVGSGSRGRAEDRWVRLKDLTSGDIPLRVRSIQTSEGGTGGDLSVPPSPEGLVVTGGFSHIHLQWNDPQRAYNNHALTRIYRSTEDNFGTAVQISQTIGFQDADLTASRGQDYYYWIRFVSESNVVGPINAPAGTLGRLSEDPQQVLDLISGQILGSDLAQSLQDEIDLISTNANAITLLEDQVSDPITGLSATYQLTANHEQFINGGGIATTISQATQSLEQAINSNASAIQQQQTITTNLSNTVAQSTQTIQQSVDGNSAAIQQQLQVTDGLSAQYTLKIDAGGRLAGWGFASSPSEYDDTIHSSALFSLDTFGIGAPGATTLTFAVDTQTGQVSMNGANIINATITSAKISDIAVDKITGLTSSFLLSNIGQGNITNAYIGNIIQSTNYVPGSTGWLINKNGFAEFSNVIVRGNITANNLDAATGTFSGQLTGDAIDAVSTINLRGNSIVIKESFSSSAILDINRRTWTTIGTKFITLQNTNASTAVTVSASFTIRIGASEWRTRHDLQVRFLKDNVPFKTVSGIYCTLYDEVGGTGPAAAHTLSKGTFCVNALDTPTDGQSQYSVQVYLNDAIDLGSFYGESYPSRREDIVLELSVGLR